MNPDNTDETTLVSLVEAVLSVPRTEDSSFTLHAPLELLARHELLGLVDNASRNGARSRIANLGMSFLSAGDAVPVPESVEFASSEAAVVVLLAAVGAGEVGTADSAAAWLADNLAVKAVAEALASPLLHVFGAAGHAHILFASWLRQPAAGAGPLRGIARSLAVSPGHVLERDRVSPPGRAIATPGGFERALCELVKMKAPDWGIYGMVRNADELGVMATLPAVADNDIEPAFRRLLRVAARSMLEDDPANAPYGSTHCLTLPLGVWQTAHLHREQRASLDLATMFVAASRVGSAAARLLPTPPTTYSRYAINTLASAASVRHDAHLAKYVLACHHASGLDPEAAGLYLEAAGHLLQWWKDNPAPEDQV